ncbi:MAG: hypothetical protein JXA81_14650 [Sedimentisphaerales bacterium]|nr:hypothetical protein [Sedimentisphaerales bacterium]
MTMKGLVKPLWPMSRGWFAMRETEIHNACDSHSEGSALFFRISISQVRTVSVNLCHGFLKENFCGYRDFSI